MIVFNKIPICKEQKTLKELEHKEMEPKIDKDMINRIIIGTKRKHSGGSVMRQELVEELH